MNRESVITLIFCVAIEMVMAILLGVFHVQPEIAYPLIIGFPLACGALAIYFEARTTSPKQANG